VIHDEWTELMILWGNYENTQSLLIYLFNAFLSTGMESETQTSLLFYMQCECAKKRASPEQMFTLAEM